MTLEHVDLRKRAKVVAIEGGRGVHSHLNTLGIHVGDQIIVIDRAPFSGPVLVEIHGSRVALGRGVANKVRVELNGLSERRDD
jgi:ferrous iron transport protein A